MEIQIKMKKYLTLSILTFFICRLCSNRRFYIPGKAIEKAIEKQFYQNKELEIEN
jgi:hypothetical protein